MLKRILVVRKMSALEYYYNGNHNSNELHAGKEMHEKNIKGIERFLKQNGKKFDVVTRKELSEKLISNYDAVISAGGDGTVIATAAYNKDIPQLNLKTDSRSAGALCQEGVKNSLRKLLSGDYTIEEWTRQDVYLDGKFIGRALNEVCIGESLKFSKLAKYDLIFRDYKLGLIRKESQSGSGLIIVTGTGSGAWPAAFKPFPKKSNYFEFNNLLLHSGRIARGSTNEFLMNYQGHEGKFAIDTAEYNLPRDSQLKIELSKFPLPAIIIGEK